jgi:ketosteroid isomerase-like protein
VPTISQLQSELADRESIRQCIYRYCRAPDRCDFDLLATAYWPDATENHDPFVGTIEEFIEFARDTLLAMDQTSHMVANILIAIDGETAHVESYVRAYHRLTREDKTKYDLVTGGRYVDVMERRGDEWRISTRTVIRDWYREYPDSANWEGELFGHEFSPGVRYPNDKSYAIFGPARFSDIQVER